MALKDGGMQGNCHVGRWPLGAARIIWADRPSSFFLETQAWLPSKP